MKLMLDGKPIGETDGKTIVSSEDENKDKRETMRVPAVRLEESLENEDEDEDEDEDSGTRDDKNDGDEDAEDDDEFAKYLKTLDPKAREFLEHTVSENTRLSKNVQRLTSKLDTILSRPNDKDEVDDVDEIGDIPKEKDPFGVAKTLKNLVKYVRVMNGKVSRLDQHAGFKEAQGNLEAAKNLHKVFKNPVTKNIAEKLLEAELKTNRTDTIEDIVASVVKDVRRLGISSAKSYVRDKANTAGRLPAGVLRTGDGATPAITVNKPRTVREAAEAYKSWRAQNARINRR
jgi:hypothetical protein